MDRTLLLLASLCLAQACSCLERRPPAPPPPPPVDVVVASTADVPSTFETIGTVESINTVLVRSRVQGQLLAILFEPGSLVSPGDALFQLDPRPFEHALAQAKAALAESEAQAGLARQEARRYGELARRGAASKQEAEQRSASATALAEAVRANQALVEGAALDLSFTTIRAPIHGRTGNLQVHVGDQIQANATVPMVTIQVMNPIFVRFSAPGDRLPEIVSAREAGPVRVTAKPRGGGKPRDGELSFIDNQVDPQTGTILLKATYSNEDELFWPGEPTDVSLLLRILRGVVVIPSEAIQVGQQGEYVFVIGPENKAESRPIRRGPVVDGKTAILQGVKEGERVVTLGQLRLEPGTEVEVRQQGSGS